MYIPSYYKEADFPKLLSFIQAHPFALLCTSGPGGIMGTHLPLVVERKENTVIITSHMARPNPQWKDFESGTEILIVFQGPHGYVSPSNYEKKQNVPTWNYIAVHAYGKAKLLPDSYPVLEKTIATFEPGFYSQWKELSAEYKEGMVKGIVSFEIEIERLEGKFKMSQNKTAQERENVIHTFENSGDGAAVELAAAMKKNK